MMVNVGRMLRKNRYSMQLAQVVQVNSNVKSTMIAGNACTKNIFLLAVMAPNTPATITQQRKNIATFCDHTASPIKNDQINPAAKKPLYNP